MPASTAAAPPIGVTLVVGAGRWFTGIRVFARGYSMTYRVNVLPGTWMNEHMSASSPLPAG